MTIDIERLVQAAQKATPGPWIYEIMPDTECYSVFPPDLSVGSVCDIYNNGADGDNAAYIAAANPATILSLLTELSAAREVVKAAQLAIENNDGYSMTCYDSVKASLTKYEEACK